ncbi:MAG: hypothetical protein PHX21_04740 [bacterium]|nr:hypothetical protein [bacterium]
MWGMLLIGILQGTVKTDTSTIDSVSHFSKNDISHTLEEPKSRKEQKHSTLDIDLMGLYDTDEDQIMPFLGGSLRFWIFEKVKTDVSCHSNILLTLLDSRIIMNPFSGFHKLYIGIGGGFMTGIIALAGYPFVPYLIGSMGLESSNSSDSSLGLEVSYLPYQLWGIKVSKRIK